MSTPHKHSALIKAWADGAAIQCRLGWPSAWINIETPSWAANCEYRVAPKTIRYRTFLWRATTTGREVVSVCTEEENRLEPRSQWAGFINWLGPWCEVPA